VPSIFFRSFIGLILGASLLLAGGAALRTIHSRSAKRPALAIVGYLPDYRCAHIDPAMLGRNYSDVILFSIEPRADGGLDTRRLASRAFKLVPALRRAGVQRVLVCVGGSQRSHECAAAAAQAATRRKLALALTELCRQQGLAGVDFDWEHPRTAQQQRDYEALLTECGTQLHRHKLLLTVAVAQWQTLGPGAIRAVDRVHLMAYDAPGQHSTFQFASQAVQDWLAKGVPAGKLCLGVPFYGRGVVHHHRARSYGVLAVQQKLDPNSDTLGDTYFNGVNTIHRKAEYALKQGLAGVMAWEVGQDTADGQLSHALRP